MENKILSKLTPGFRPALPVIYVSDDGITEIPAEAITIDLVGEKAFGLLSVPELWTLPFIVVSHILVSKYMNSPEEQRAALIADWSDLITSAAIVIGIHKDDEIIVRSSGCAEGLEERGKFYSVPGNLTDVSLPITSCLRELSTIVTSVNDKVPLVVQKYIFAPSATGHLSNERRLYEEKRDWLGEFEDEKSVKNSSFVIHLRNWRKKIDVNKYTEAPLNCNLSAHVSEILHIPATWAYNRNARCHFEWIWDGNRIYIVQADQDYNTKGINPTVIHHQSSRVPLNYTPRFLKAIEKEHALKYEKINNVFTYLDLGLPIAKLYILDDQSTIKNLANGLVPTDLEMDIRQLIKNSLVIRMDIATTDKKKRQLLPRIEEYEFSSAIQWLIEQSKVIMSSGIREDVAFIFHNFVPATASAFAYAAPGERKVQIEALWGLPEGLYYNAHDKYVVDTQTTVLDEIAEAHFTIEEMRNFKRFFVCPNEDGRWTSKILKAPYDWKGSIQKHEWTRKIALESRRIANAVGKPLSIMWFVNVSKECCSSRVFPWYHEVYDIPTIVRPRISRKKTPFDETYTISTNVDLSFLRNEAEKANTNIRCIKIQPRDDDLLRNRNALREIGELTRKMGAVIYLEGGVLSHAYYQLVQTEAVVEIVHPFRASEGKIEFNKLVRDKIPQNIELGGEAVETAHLTGEFLMRLLREKLVEEAFEVLDAVDQDAIIGELADVSEVIDGILSHIRVSKEDLEFKQRKKREKAGGFKDGTVLLETRNPLPTNKTDVAPNLFHNGEAEAIRRNTMNERPGSDLDHTRIEKWSDKKKHPSSNEAIMRLLVPTVRDHWTAHSSDSTVEAKSQRNIRIKLSGTRIGAKYQIELSIYSPNEQLVLFDYDDPEKS